MLELSPFLLVGLGMSAVSLVAALVRRRKHRSLAALSDADLQAVLHVAQGADIETRRRLTVIVVEEMERRRS